MSLQGKRISDSWPLHSVREARLDDIPAIADLYGDFHKETICKTGLGYDRDTNMRTICSFFKRPKEFVVLLALEGDVPAGVAIGGIGPSFFDSNEIMGTELVWFVNSDHRGGSLGSLMLKELEQKLAEKGAKFLVMAHMDFGNKKIMERYYKKRGYRPMETHYVKAIKEEENA